MSDSHYVLPGRWFGAITLTVLLLAPTARAQESPSFSFADTGAISATCAELAEGVEIVVHNDRATPQSVAVVLGHITDGDGEPVEAADVCGGVEATVSEPAPTTDEAGNEVAALVAAAGDAIVSVGGTDATAGEKTYITTLAIYGSAGTVARRGLTISEKPAAEVALPLIDSREVSHQRFNPCDDWVVWVPVALAATKTPALAAGSTVGVLSGEQGTTAVTVGDEKLRRLTATTSLVPLHIAAVGAGKYSGNVDLTPGDDESGKIVLSLTAKHWWPLALAAILVGIALALLVQWLNGYVLTRGRLLRRVNAVTAIHAGARERLVAAAAGESWGNFKIDDDDLKDALDDLRDEVGRRTARKEVVVDQKIVDDLVAKIDGVEKQISALDTIATAAPLLEAAIVRLAAERPQTLPPLQGPDASRPAPRLVESATVTMDGAPLTAAELVERAATLAAMTAAARALHDADLALAHYWELARVLERDLPATERPKAVEVKDRLEGLRHALWDAGSPKEVDAAVADFEDVRDKIDALWPGLPDERPFSHYRVGRIVVRRGEMLPIETSYALSPVGTRTVGRLGDEVYVFGDDDLAEVVSASAGAQAQLPLPPVPPPPRRPLSEAEAARLVETAFATQWLVLGISLVIAAITALSALYVANAWGTPWDYIFAAAWGLITQTALAAVAGALGGLGAVAALRQGVGRPRV